MHKKFTVTPAILPTFFSEVKEKLDKIHSVARLVQIDFCDGTYVPSKTWGYNNHDRNVFAKMVSQEFELPYPDEIDYEFDLMIAKPEQDIEKFIAMGPKNIILHYNSLQNPIEFFKNLDPIISEHISFGCAFANDTEIEKILEVIPLVKFIQIMGIDHIGKQGEVFNERTLELIKKIRATNTEVQISVDGGVNENNLNDIINAGANRVAVGSALFNTFDPIDTYKKLSK